MIRISRETVLACLMCLGLLLISCNKSEDSVTPPVEEEEEIVGDPGKAAADCYPAFEEDELNVVTWNIENFPMRTTTSEKTIQLIEALDADIIAVQEITDQTEFLALAESMDDWEAIFADVRYSQDLGFLYKDRAFTSMGSPIQLFDDDASAFPRQAVRLDATHISGLEVTFITLHLKCCGGDNSSEQNRRAAASLQLETYIETNLADKAVIVLGDFNDDIVADPVTPFQNFLDNADFTFADLAIAEGSDTNWSFPDWPSHLDHILISNELFDKVRGVETIMPESCITSYATVVSDHRPVLASFK